jgi:uncharacterized protein YvpB
MSGGGGEERGEGNVGHHWVGRFKDYDACAYKISESEYSDFLASFFNSFCELMGRWQREPRSVLFKKAQIMSWDRKVHTNVSKTWQTDGGGFDKSGLPLASYPGTCSLHVVLIIKKSTSFECVAGRLVDVFESGRKDA